MSNLEIRKALAVELFGITDVFQFADKGCENMLNTDEPHFPPPATCLVPEYESTGDGMLEIIEAMRAKGWTIELGETLRGRC